MLELKEHLGADVWVDKAWWTYVKYGIGLPLLGGIPTAAAFWYWVL